MTKIERVIQFIRDAGASGRRFTEIQRFIVELNGLNYDEMVEVKNWNTGKMTQKRRWRGYWCTNLTGGMMYGRGQLHYHGCTKNSEGRWICA